MSRRAKQTGLQAATLKTMTARLSAPVLVLLAITLILFNKIEQQTVERLRVMTMDGLAPVIATAARPFAVVAESLDGVVTLRDLKAENIRLYEENVKLQQWYQTALRLQAENKSLHDLLNLQVDPEMTYISARVIADPGGAFVKSILLPIGSQDGVTKGSAVLSGQGLAGRVTEVGARASRVLLVTDLNSRIPVLVQNTRHKAILAGKNRDLLQLERLPLNSGVEVGARLVTSGDGGLLPADIPVGIVTEVSAEGVFVRPLAPLDQLLYVQVVNAQLDPALATGIISSDPSLHRMRGR